MISGGGHQRGEKKLHLISWDKIYKARGEGGLGFRKMNCVNQAFLAKHAWRLLNDPGSLMSNIFLSKYCHNEDFLVVQCRKTLLEHGRVF